MAKKVLDHPSVDRTDRFALDGLLRDNGWQIAYRPKHGEAVWQKNRIRRRRSEALMTLDAKAVADAEMVEDIYHDIHNE